jgi:hypothetical protein
MPTSAALRGYYRAVRCPAPKLVARCADRADPGRWLTWGELVAAFQRDPTLGPLRWRDQAAEEAFTVYDHPKVLIFAKRPDFSADQVRALLEGIDLSGVINAPPNELGAPPKDLLLTEARVQQRRWDLVRLFAPEPAEPLAAVHRDRLVAGHRPDRPAGVPAGREGSEAACRLSAGPPGGTVFIAWAGWLAGSLGIGYTRGTILLALLALAAAGGLRLAGSERAGCLLRKDAGKCCGPKDWSGLLPVRPALGSNRSMAPLPGRRSRWISPTGAVIRAPAAMILVCRRVYQLLLLRPCWWALSQVAGRTLGYNLIL